MAHSSKAQRQAVNIYVKQSVLERAKGLDINLSAICQRALEEAVIERQQELWLEQHENAIEVYNRKVDQEPVFNEDGRTF